MDVIVGAFIAVAGWLAAHYLSLRAQRKTLRYQVLDRARVEITRGIREYQDWLSQLSAEIWSAESSANLEFKGHPANWIEVYKRISSFVSSHRVAGKWNRSLEEHLILFPDCAEARIELQNREREINSFVAQFSSELFSTLGDPLAMARRNESIARAAKYRDQLMDQSALLEDLLVHLQNVTLGEITGNSVPFRDPPDPRVPRFVPDKRGVLRLTIGQVQSKAV